MAITALRRSRTDPHDDCTSRTTKVVPKVVPPHRNADRRTSLSRGTTDITTQPPGQDQGAFTADHGMGELGLEIWSTAHFFAWEHLHAFGKRLGTLEVSLQAAAHQRPDDRAVESLLVEIRAEMAKTQQMCEQEAQKLGNVEQLGRNLDERMGRVLDRLATLETDLEWFRGEQTAIKNLTDRLDGNMDAIIERLDNDGLFDDRSSSRTGGDDDRLQVIPLSPPKSTDKTSGEIESEQLPSDYQEKDQAVTSADLSQDMVVSTDAEEMATATTEQALVEASDTPEVDVPDKPERQTCSPAAKPPNQSQRKTRFRDFKRYTESVAKRFKREAASSHKAGSGDGALIWEYFDKMPDRAISAYLQGKLVEMYPNMAWRAAGSARHPGRIIRLRRLKWTHVLDLLRVTQPPADLDY